MKKTVILILAMLIICSIPVFGDYVYQEDADNTACQGTWAASPNSCDAAYDGSWDAPAGWGNINGWLYVNYTKPIYVDAALWQVKDNNSKNETLNLTIPDICFDQSILQLGVMLNGTAITALAGPL